MKNSYNILRTCELCAAKVLALTILLAGFLPLPSLRAVTVTAVTSGNGHPAHEVQWVDSAGLPRSAIMVDQSASGPGYLFSLTYQYNGSPRVCAGTGITGYTGDGFVENHNTQGGDNNSLDDETPGTTTILLPGSSHAIIEYSMPTYQILGETIPTTICWFFADGRSNPIFAISQDARATGGNLGADTRSPYGSLNFDGTAEGDSDVGGASYGDTYKFVTLAANPEEVTGLSGWSDNQPNTIPYAMEWIDPAEVDAEMGHVATVPITIQDEGKDRDLNSTLDPRDTAALGGPMIPYGPTLASGANGPDAWAFQLLDYILHPDYQGDGQGANASVQTSYCKLAWAGNFGRVGGYNNGNNALNGTQYSQHYNSGADIFTGTRVSGMLMAYSVFEVLGAHNGSYTNGAVGQTVLQMQNATQATLSATIGSVATTGPAGVGNATNASVTYSPAGFNPTYATWELTATTNTVNATLAVNSSYPLDHPIFMIDNYATNVLPASIAVGAGLTNANVNYFASLDAGSHRLWITVNRVVSNSLNLVVKFSLPAALQPAPVVAGFSPVSGGVGTSVVITGQNLTNATAVTFGGVAAITYTTILATQITATVPAGATTGPISVTTPGGSFQTSSNFTVTALAPAISSFSPTTGPVGTSVVITGSNLTGATAVGFNGVAATAFTVNSATQITATVPAGAATGHISVTTPGGTVQSTANFTVTVTAPVIASFSPTSGLAGGIVIITGTGFTGATAVTFNGVAATTFTVNSATQVTVTVPAAATTGVIAVTTPGGTANSPASFTVVAPAAGVAIYTDSLLNGFQDYSWATVNDSCTSPVYAGSDSVSVSAPQFTAFWPYHAPFATAPYSSLNFWINGGASGAQGIQLQGVVNNAGVTAYNLPALAANTWTNFNIPLSALGVANITNCEGFWFYANGAGTTTFYVDSIQLNDAVPGITTFSPASGAVGTAVTISGTNFTGVTTVTFNGVAASFSVNSAATQITTTVPAGAATGLISVTAAGGIAQSATAFTVPVIPNTPAITSFAPASGTAGTVVTITGTNFNGITNVSFNGLAATNFTVNSKVQITVTVPSGATTGPISVVTPVGTAASSTAFVVPATGTFVNGLFVKGANLPWLDGQYDHDIGTSPENNYSCAYNSAHMNQYLTDMHTMGITVVRLWLNEDKQGLVLDGSGNVTGLQSLFLTNLDNIVQLAAANQISLYLTLNEGDSDWVLNTTEQASYLKYAVTPLAARYQGNSHIFAFDVMNEIDGVVDSDGATWAEAQAYVTAAVAAIHSADPARLATCSVGYVPAWPTLANLRGLGMDFYDFHDYEDVPTFPSAASLNLDKPILIGECGQATTTLSDTIQNTCELDFLNSAKTNGYAGAAIWAYQYPGDTSYLAMLNPSGTWRPVCYSIQSWNYQPIPIISAFSPAVGLAGTEVTITGQNFTNATAVAFNGVPGTGLTINSAAQITVTVPVGVTTGPLTVTTFGGLAQSATNFVVPGSVPVISSFSPTNGAPGTSVVITGANFTGATAVAFNGSAAAFVINSATQITATVPDGAASGPISVTTSGGTTTSTGSFIVVLPPYISTYPSSGVVGTPIIITGQYFTGATNVAFNGTPASFTVNSDSQITAIVPAGATAGQITVTTPAGTAYSISLFTPLGPPIISSITGQGTVGMVIAVLGQGFTGATNVSFNGEAASFTVNSDAQITTTVPTNATPGPISVSTLYGTGKSATSFTVLVGSITNSPIYVDGLVNGFQDYSWATNVNDETTSPVYSGTDSIRVTAAPFTALSLYHVDFNTAPYASLSFWINGGAAGAAGLQVMGVIDVGGSQDYANIVDLPPLAANTWTQFNFSLAALGIANVTNCDGFWFWPTASGATTFYVDSIQLDYPISAPALGAAPSKPGALVLQLAGTAGESYWLQSSTNLTRWTTVSTNTLPASSVNITNLVVPGNSRIFWRAVLP